MSTLALTSRKLVNNFSENLNIFAKNRETRRPSNAYNSLLLPRKTIEIQIALKNESSVITCSAQQMVALNL